MLLVAETARSAASLVIFRSVVGDEFILLTVVCARDVIVVVVAGYQLPRTCYNSAQSLGGVARWTQDGAVPS